MELEAKRFSSALYLSRDITKGSTLLPSLHTTVTLPRPSVVSDTSNEGPLCSLCQSCQVWRINSQLKTQQDYIHKVPRHFTRKPSAPILRNRQGPPNSVTVLPNSDFRYFRKFQGFRCFGSHKKTVMSFKNRFKEASGLNFELQQDYIHKVLVILQDNVQRESHKPYAPPTSVTCLQPLRKQTNTGTSTALTAETR